MYFGVKTLADLDVLKWHYEWVINPVQQRIGELACLELGPQIQVIRSVSRKEVIPDRRYSWRLYADEKGTELVDVVVLDINLGGALDIDVEVREQMEGTPNSRSVARPHLSPVAPFLCLPISSLTDCQVRVSAPGSVALR